MVGSSFSVSATQEGLNGEVGVEMLVCQIYAGDVRVIGSLSLVKVGVISCIALAVLSMCNGSSE